VAQLPNDTAVDPDKGVLEQVETRVQAIAPHSQFPQGRTETLQRSHIHLPRRGLCAGQTNLMKLQRMNN
jgi:hypothetical protein